MGHFFRSLFASCLGTLLALALLLFIAIGSLAGLASKGLEKAKVDIKPNSVLVLTLDKVVPEKTNNVPLSLMELEQEDVLGLHDIIRAIRKAKEDPDIKGIYLDKVAPVMGWSSASTLRAALEDFRSSGKFVIAYADLYTQSGYYIASVSDEVWLNPIGMVDFRGLSSLILFFKGMLDKLDVQMRIFYAGKFKSATEPFRSDKMSPENRLQVREYLTTVYNSVLADISASRKMALDSLRSAVENFDGRAAHTALRSRLVDRLAYEDEANKRLKERLGLSQEDKLPLVKIEDYFATRVKKTDWKSKDKIAIVYAEGALVGGKEGEPGEIADGPYVKLLRKVRKDKAVKAIVLRINSPGGSVLASENILREVILCREAGKPVIVSMGDVAASGGYYIACQADSIFAEPTTITGSIGVFGLIPILQNTMKNKLGITADTVRTQRYSAMGTPFFDFSPDESRLIQAQIDRIYADFLERVAKGRRMTPEQVHEIAQGRVWAGQKAREIGLVDDLGGLDRALSAAAKRAGIEKYRVVEYPATKTPIEQLLDKITQTSDPDDEVRTWMMRSDLGELYPMYRMLRDARKNQGIQARLPYEIILR
ncbi:MAG: signal peptide peptidase SppA [Saprospiraceae bacterium]|nr:signal peptide peptidase SppA [Saprospiraceae bacterium]MDW8485263.1 signal peptide peptidase SppA [Saprospiraceae bacterium]